MSIIFGKPLVEWANYKPDWPYELVDPQVNRKDSATITWALNDGRTKTTNIGGMGGTIQFAPGALSAVREALGNISTACPIQMRETRDTFIAPKNAVVWDELYDAGYQLRVVLQNNNGEEQAFYVPAPRHDIFGSDDITLLEGDTGAAAGTPEKLVGDMKANVAAIINNTYDPVNSYEVVRAYRTDTSDRLPKPGNAKPTFVEGDIVPV